MSNRRKTNSGIKTREVFPTEWNVHSEDCPCGEGVSVTLGFRENSRVTLVTMHAENAEEFAAAVVERAHSLCADCREKGAAA
jgi:hypothetical protein